MAKNVTETATLTPNQLAARLCYRLATCPDEIDEVPEDALLALAEVVGTPLTTEQLLQYAAKLRRAADRYDVSRAQLIARWGPRMDPEVTLSDDEALAFIVRQFLEVDHSVLYEQGVTASRSLYQRGTIRDSELNFPGSMPCWTLHLTTQGEALFLNECMEVTVRRGDMMLFSPEASYHYGLHPSAERWEHLWALFQPRSHWQQWMDWQKLAEGVMYLTLPTPEVAPAVEGLFDQLLQLNEVNSPYQSDLQQNRVEEILIRAREYGARSDAIAQDKRIERACNYIQSNLTEKFCVADVAAACNLSSSRLAHLFKEHMGLSLKSWSSNLRLQYARKKLLNSNDSIAVIAREIGYENPNQFSSYFRKSTGCSPREFRQSFREQKFDRSY